MDELRRLRRANPITDRQTRGLVDVDRHVLVDAVDEDRWQHRPGFHPYPSNEAETSPKRVLAGAIAAAIVLIFAGVTIADRLDERGVIETSVAAPGPGGDGLVVDSVDQGFDRTTDLLVVHFDYVDRGDAHAAVAAREVATWFNLDPVVVAGTQTLGSDRSVHDYASVMDAAWDDLWFDAALNRPAAIEDSLERWLITLDAGGRVWVAEGGVSDFTAELVREISVRRPGLNTQSLIHVVQRNDDARQRGEVAFTQTNTAYGQLDPDAAIDLRGESDAFEASVLSGSHRDRWSAAFEYLSTADLDFSDAALLLDILGVATEHVSDPNDFAAFFIGDQPDAQFREGP